MSTHKINSVLNVELTQIASAFPSTHSFCQLIVAGDNLIHFKFELNGSHLVVCNIQEPYVSTVPVWSTESDNALVKEALQDLTTSTFSTKFKVTAMLRSFIFHLCTKFNVDPPPEFKLLGRNLPPEDDTDESSDSDGAGANVASVDEPTEGRSLAATASGSATQQTQRTNPSAMRASKRLMKEYQAICESQHVKDGFFSVHLDNDSLFEWIVKVYKVDPDCRLYQDMLTMKEEMGKDAIGLSISFKDNYPFEPPFVRVIYPMIKGGYVMNGGAICLEILTSDGWSSVYTIESLILQVIAAFAKGGARISLGVNTESYSYTNALRNFERLSALHDNTGWYSSAYDRS